MPAVVWRNGNGKLRYQPELTDGRRLVRTTSIPEYPVHIWLYYGTDRSDEPVLYRSKKRAERKAERLERLEGKTTWTEL